MIKRTFNFVLLFMFTILSLHLFNTKALYIADDTYQQILKGSEPIVQSLVNIDQLDISMPSIDRPDNTKALDYSKSILHAKKFNSYMTAFFTAFKELIDRCENKKDSWFF